MTEGRPRHELTREPKMQEPTTQNPTTQNPTTQDPAMQYPGKQRSKEQDRAPEEIRGDIRRTRGEMDRTVDELVDRFSVGSLVDEAWQRMRRGGGGGADVKGMLREHPVPIALVGLGLGWLAVEQASGHSVSTDTFGSGTRAGGAPEPKTNRSQAGGGDGITEGDGITGKVSDQASEAMSTAREKVSDIKESTKAAGARTRAGFHELLDASPLSVGSLVFGLGLASGLAVPSSDLEDREMGEASDRIKSEAGRLGSEAAKRAGEIGHEVADTAMSETRNQVDDLREDAGDESART